MRAEALPGLDPAVFEALAQRAVEAATAAGASYADARVTRTLEHHYHLHNQPNALEQEVERLGLGVRVLVQGYWGFSASALWDPEEAVRLAQEAVTQAKLNARGTPRIVELDQVPAVTGRWATPIEIDSFSISIEEKADTIAYWRDCATELGLAIVEDLGGLHFARQEQTLSTSTGTLISQTCYESGGDIWVRDIRQGTRAVLLSGLEVAGKGWELFSEVPELLTHVPARIAEFTGFGTKAGLVGRYTVVLAGPAMAHIVAQTFGVATQLDRALGYEANAGGTSYLDDPLGTLGTLQVAAPTVTITANRSAPAQLATVKWDAEGVEPQEVTLVKQGVLVDYQTTREQAAWLAPYYQKTGKSVKSHGYAAAEDALSITLQHMPNLALEPGGDNVGLEDLIGTIQDGILVRNLINPTAYELTMDHQARNGYLLGQIQQIKNGRLGPLLATGEDFGILFNTQDFWKRIVALGGLATRTVVPTSAFNDWNNYVTKWQRSVLCKGQPVQLTSHSVSAPAAIVTNQSLINRRRV